MDCLQNSVSNRPGRVNLSRRIGHSIDSAELRGGTATAGPDYTAQSGSLAFTPAGIIRVFSLPIQDDKRDERDETVGLMLSNPTGGGGATVGVLSQALLSIFDDDGRNGGGWWSGYQGSNDEDGWWFGRRRR